MKTRGQQSFRAVARIQKAFGVRGEMKAVSYARTAQELSAIGRLVRGKDDTSVVPCEIERVTERGGALYLKITGIDDKEAAERAAGEFLFIDEHRRKEPPAGSYYDDEVLDCVVVDEQGTRLGSVHDVVLYPASKVFEVSTPHGLVMVPAVREIVISVDVRNKIVVVRPPEGMFSGSMME